MIETQDGHVVPIKRPRVIDMAQPKQQKRRRRQHPKERDVQQHDERDEGDHRFPIEMQSVIRASKEYARRTHALGALRGATAITDLTSRIRSLGPQVPDMEKILSDADASAELLRALLNKVYEDA